MLCTLREMFTILRKYQIKLNPLKCAFGLSSGKFLGFMVNQQGMEANHEKIQAFFDIKSPLKPKKVQSLTGKVVAHSRFVLRAMEKYLSFFNAFKEQVNSNGQSNAKSLRNIWDNHPLLSKPIERGPLSLNFQEICYHDWLKIAGNQN